VVENNRGHNYAPGHQALYKDVGGWVLPPANCFRGFGVLHGSQWGRPRITWGDDREASFANALAHSAGRTLIDVRVDVNAVIPAGEHYNSLKQGSYHG